MDFLLDTNHCIYLLNGRQKEKARRSEAEKKVIFAVKNTNESLYMSEATYGELIYGVEYSKRKVQNLQELEKLVQAIPMLNITGEAWQIFGKTKAHLRVNGIKIPDMDLLIASTAKHYDLTLVSNDVHLERLPNTFQRVDWTR